MNMFLDPWLNSKDFPFVATTLVPHFSHARVADFMMPNGREWDSDLVNTVFEDEDVRKILSITICPNFDDSWYWRPENNGVYSVRSAYRIQIEAAGHDMPVGSFVDWNLLWRLKIPPTIRNFLWRSLRGVLPVRQVLFNRHVDLETVACPLCGAASESIAHLLLHCPTVLEVWNRAGVDYGMPDMDFPQWFQGLFAQASKELLIKVSASQQKQWETATVRRAAAVPVSGPPIIEEWTPPLAPSLKCNFDAAICSRTGKVTFGAVVRDHAGSFVAARSGELFCAADPNLAETLACKEALSWLREKGVQDVILETDCLQLQRALVSNIPDMSYTGYIISACKAFGASFSFISFQHVRRHGNIVAHILARTAISLSSQGNWTDIPPDCIQFLF
ncbi:hypothetical protein OROMI_027146 [Orobanche minor]